MNNLLKLKGTFEQKKNKAGYGKPALPPGSRVSSESIASFSRRLSQILDYWAQRQQIFEGALINVRYCEVIAKSNRIKKVFTNSSQKSDNDSIVGARFSADSRKHIITHFITLRDLEEAIEKLDAVGNIIRQAFHGTILPEDLETLEEKEINYQACALTRTLFAQIIVDLNKVERFDIPNNLDEIDVGSQSIVSFYDIGLNVDEIAEKAGLRFVQRKIDQHTALFDADDLMRIRERIPNLVAMSLKNLEEMQSEKMAPVANDDEALTIPDPSNEPVVGVIDTRFNSEVYFSKWVDYHDLVDKNLPEELEDYKHGTAVSSIIVDGPSFNQSLDDGCGRFRVRHFAVGKHNAIDLFHLIESVKRIVVENRDIKVWNLSLGAKSEIQKNSISPVAALLDEIQYEEDVVFVVSGTNKPDDDAPEHMRIGSPADSINSLVVNAVNANNEPASYTREGIVLSFFNKPDLCYYGGDVADKEDSITVCTSLGEGRVMGTSFAAPWITRKMAYLIHILGMTREEAKALLIDAASRWDTDYMRPEVARVKGFGVVPVHIRDIVQSQQDEIKFIISGVSEEYDTYNYNIPVPQTNEGFPYNAKATLCYFPRCDRKQGVDYTSTELDVYFGRIDEKGKIRSINQNRQSINYGSSPAYIKEGAARKLYRKWDNTKHICQSLKPRARAKKSYGSALWGLSIKTKERLGVKYGERLRFGVVITLKEINGVNRIEDFIQQCNLRGWLVQRIDVEQQVELYNKLEEKLIIK